MQSHVEGLTCPDAIPALRSSFPSLSNGSLVWLGTPLGVGIHNQALRLLFHSKEKT